MLEIEFSIGQTYFPFEIAWRKTTVTPSVKVRAGQNGSFFAESTVLRMFTRYKFWKKKLFLFSSLEQLCLERRMGPHCPITSQYSKKCFLYTSIVIHESQRDRLLMALAIQIRKIFLIGPFCPYSVVYYVRVERTTHNISEVSKFFLTGCLLEILTVIHVNSSG